MPSAPATTAPRIVAGKRRKSNQMADSFTRNILMKDLAAMQKSPLPFAWIPEDVLIDDNILAWQLWILGPEGTS